MDLQKLIDAIEQSSSITWWESLKEYQFNAARERKRLSKGNDFISLIVSGDERTSEWAKHANRVNVMWQLFHESKKEIRKQWPELLGDFPFPDGTRIDSIDVPSAARAMQGILGKILSSTAQGAKISIPPDRLSKPITKAKAAKLLGRPGDPKRAVEWLNKCIADGTIWHQPTGRQSGRYDLSQFPESSHKQMKP